MTKKSAAFLRRSAAAKRGWFTRRLNSAPAPSARSIAAKRGWDTRRAREAEYEDWRPEADSGRAYVGTLDIPGLSAGLAAEGIERFPRPHSKAHIREVLRSVGQRGRYRVSAVQVRSGRPGEGASVVAVDRPRTRQIVIGSDFNPGPPPPGVNPVRSGISQVTGLPYYVIEISVYDYVYEHGIKSPDEAARIIAPAVAARWARVHLGRYRRR